MKNSSEKLFKSSSMTCSSPLPSQSITSYKSLRTSKFSPSSDDFFFLEPFPFSSTSPTPQKQEIKTRISFLSQFGLLPGKSLRITPKCKPKTVPSVSIKLSDFIGKKNLRKIVKSIDLETVLSSARSCSPENCLQKGLTTSAGMLFRPSSNEGSKERKKSSFGGLRKPMTANGPRNLEKRSKDMQAIDRILKECEELQGENRKSLKDLRDLKKRRTEVEEIERVLKECEEVKGENKKSLKLLRRFGRSLKKEDSFCLREFW